ncbi:hypothetical protein [Haloplanus sp. C73]|uniref:hypothetical protein n=1 Tax=Haloplanus sp. C73 TaxID=3421641 RepID=UPI003EBDE4DA
MSRYLRRLTVVLALCVVASMSFGVGGYSSVDADRNVSVSVVEDEDAYLAFDDSLGCGVGNNVLVRNQFVGNTTIERIEVDVTAVGGYVRVGVRGPGTQLAPGDSTQLTFLGPYEPGDAARMQVKPPTGNVSGADSLNIELLEATGQGVSVSVATQSYVVNCPGGPSKSTGNDGQGN